MNKLIDQFIKIIIIASLPILLFIPKEVYPRANPIPREKVTQSQISLPPHGQSVSQVVTTFDNRTILL